MFLEGEINWTLVFGAAAAVFLVTALVSLVYAIRNKARHSTASGQLDLVQRVAESSDRRLFETLNAVPVALVETDHAGKFVFANRAAHQLLGRRDAELLGLRFHSATWGITFPDGKPIPPDLLPSARALRGQTVRGFQHLMINAASRRKMLVSVTAMPIENEAGRVTGSIAAIVETEALITPAIEPSIAFEDRPQEPAVPAGPSLTDLVFNAAPSALVIIDSHGRTLRLNAVAQALTGIVEGMEGQAFADLFVAEGHRGDARQALAAALANPDADPVLAPGPDMQPMQWTLLPLGTAASQEGAVLLAGTVVEPEESPAVVASPDMALPVDVEADASPVAQAVVDQAVQVALTSARQEFEQSQAEILAARDQALSEAAIARDKAEKAEREARAEVEASRRMESVGRLTGGVAHDFNALLTVMTTALDMLLRQADDPDRVRRLGQAALAAGQRGENLTRRLTAFAEGDDRTQSLDVGVLLRSIETKLRAEAGTEVDLMIEAPPAFAPARIDPVVFEGAVRALVRNAAEASPGSASVAVRLEALDDHRLCVSVRDSGPGMDEDTARRAIEPFFTTKAGAAGLGLPQAYAFARQSSGELRIESAPGEGTQVSIIFPGVV